MHQLALQIWERVAAPPRDPVQWDCPTNLAIGSTLGTFVFSIPMTCGAATGSAIVFRQRVWRGLEALALWLRLARDELMHFAMGYAYYYVEPVQLHLFQLHCPVCSYDNTFTPHNLKPLKGPNKARRLCGIAFWALTAFLDLSRSCSAPW